MDDCPIRSPQSDYACRVIVESLEREVGESPEVGAEEDRLLQAGEVGRVQWVWQWAECGRVKRAEKMRSWEQREEFPSQGEGEGPKRSTSPFPEEGEADPSPWWAEPELAPPPCWEVAEEQFSFLV